MEGYEQFFRESQKEHSPKESDFFTDRFGCRPPYHTYHADRRSRVPDDPKHGKTTKAGLGTRLDYQQQILVTLARKKGLVFQNFDGHLRTY